LVEKLVGEATLLVRIGALPKGEHLLLDGTKRLVFWNARVGDAIEARVFEFFLLLGRQISPVGNPPVVVMCDEIEDILFEVRAGTTDSVYGIATNHLGERQTEFRRAHRARERDEHFAATLDVPNIPIGSVPDAASVEMPVMLGDEIANVHRGTLRDSLSDETVATRPREPCALRRLAGPSVQGVLRRRNAIKGS
jgi:hypothetical protein